MGKIVISLFSTFDGVVEAPDAFMRNWDDVMAEDLQNQLSTWEVSLLGRRQYDDWAAYWPSYQGSADDAFARKINTIPKYVVTSTPLETHWEGSEILGDPEAPLAERVAPLRTSQIAGDVMVGGSITLASALLRENLADEVRLLVTPYVAGAGQRLFENVTDKSLELVSATTTPTGSVLVRYEVPTG